MIHLDPASGSEHAPPPTGHRQSATNMVWLCRTRISGWSNPEPSLFVAAICHHVSPPRLHDAIQTQSARPAMGPCPPSPVIIGTNLRFHPWVATVPRIHTRRISARALRLISRGQNDAHPISPSIQLLLDNWTLIGGV